MTGAAVPFEISLMVVFRRPEPRRRQNLRDDRARVILLLAIARCNRGALLRVTVREDGRAILIADVGSLTIELRGIVNLPKDVQQRLVVDPLRIERNLDGFGVAGRVAADLAVRWVLDVAAGIARYGLDDARNAPESVLDAPEATGCKGCGLRAHTSLE